MAQTTNDSDSLVERVNELYWSDSKTVDEIIEELGISRSSLYSSIEPLPAGLICADCHERMVFSNRTMRDRGVAVCPNCGRESEPGEARAAWESGTPSPAPDREPATPAKADEWIDVIISIPPQRVALVVGGAALGIVLGAVATGLLREHR